MNTLPATILAAILLAVTTTQAAFTYTTNADGVSVTITGYSGSVPDDLVIPSNINGLTVTAIGVDAFAAVNNLTSVAIPSTVTTIEEGAFTVSGLTKVTIPYGVTNIGEGAFSSCYNLTSAIIPQSVTYIGQGAFLATALLSVTIPASVINFGEGAFANGNNLTNVVMESGITDLGPSYLFGGNDMLPSLTVPATVTNLGEKTFQGCTTLSNVFFMGNAPTVDSTVFLNVIYYGFHDVLISNYYTETAYYLPGTTGWDEFMTNTLMAATDGSPTNVFVPAVEWNPTIQVSGTNFGIQNGQYGFDITATTNLPIAIEACNDPAQTNWTVLKRLTLTNGLYHFIEPFQTNTPARFYRIAFP